MKVFNVTLSPVSRRTRTLQAVDPQISLSIKTLGGDLYEKVRPGTPIAPIWKPFEVRFLDNEKDIKLHHGFFPFRDDYGLSI
jgi:hypothetical protein